MQEGALREPHSVPTAVRRLAGDRLRARRAPTAHAFRAATARATRVFVRGALGADDRWRGTFRVRTRVLREGRLVDRCRLERRALVGGAGVMRAGLIAGACVAALLLAPVAEAAEWRGKTRQGRMAKVSTGADGLVTLVRIRYRARCTDDKMLTTGVKFLPPLEHVDRQRVRRRRRFRLDASRAASAPGRRRASTAACGAPAAGPATSASACGSPGTGATSRPAARGGSAGRRAPL